MSNLEEQDRLESIKTSTIVKVSLVASLVIVTVLGIVFGSSYISTYNALNTLNKATEQAYSNVDTQLQRRSDLIPNLVSTVKGYASHEEQIYSDIANARAQLNNATTIDEKDKANTQLESALSRLLVVVEQYPDLKASEQFTSLQTQLEGTENRITIARQRYNETATEYNTYLDSFFVNMFFKGTYKPRELFKATEQAQQAPAVDFSK